METAERRWRPHRPSQLPPREGAINPDANPDPTGAVTEIVRTHSAAVPTHSISESTDATVNIRRFTPRILPPAQG